MKHLRIVLLLIAVTLCSCVYHQPIEQGNILTPAKMQTIHNGMTSAQVVAQLGTPVLQNIYSDNRMAYVYTRQPTRKRTEITRFIVHFHNDHVVDIQNN